MKLALITDAWTPQVNGVVTTLVELVRELELEGHEVEVIHPGQFTTRPCPGYAGIDLAVRPGPGLRSKLDALAPDSIHIATEGPLGWAARSYCLKRKFQFTTAFHTRFPEILQAALHIPLSWGYALFRHFHKPSSGVMVPTQAVLQMLSDRGFTQLKPWTHGVDTELFQFEPQVRIAAFLGTLPRPVSLYVGRVSYEKNIQAFLDMSLPGTKIVCGVGPLLTDFQARYPDVKWLGLLDRSTLSSVYAAADVFVFPSRSETFGLVMLEAMACGTPVAAYPVDGPNEVLGGSHGGVLDEDLMKAWTGAMACPRAAARARALELDWAGAARMFTAHLVPVQVRPGLRPQFVTPLSSDGHTM